MQHQLSAVSCAASVVHCKKKCGDRCAVRAVADYPHQMHTLYYLVLYKMEWEADFSIESSLRIIRAIPILSQANKALSSRLHALLLRTVCQPSLARILRSGPDAPVDIRGRENEMAVVELNLVGRPPFRWPLRLAVVVGDHSTTAPAV